jgi:hypothetical protein
MANRVPRDRLELLSAIAKVRKLALREASI